MRTQQEILDRIKKRKDKDVFGFEWPYYAGALTFENVKPFLKDGVTEDDWDQDTEEGIKKQAIEYMEFAWEKANDCRGLSAGRSIKGGKVTSIMASRN